MPAIRINAAVFMPDSMNAITKMTTMVGIAFAAYTLYITAKVCIQYPSKGNQ